MAALQGRKLPDKIDGTLQPVFKLKKRSEFTKWEYRVHASLELLDLEDLVSDLPRPNGNAPSYMKWRKQTWFISAIHNDLLDDIMDCGERLEYADEFLRKIRKIFVGHAGNHIYKICYPDSGKIVRSSHVDFNEDGDEDDNQHIAGSFTAGPRGPTPNTNGGDDAVVPFKYNVRPEPQEEHITGLFHTITPDTELPAPPPPTIHHTIENQSH